MHVCLAVVDVVFVADTRHPAYDRKGRGCVREACCVREGDRFTRGVIALEKGVFVLLFCCCIKVGEVAVDGVVLVANAGHPEGGEQHTHIYT